MPTVDIHRKQVDAVNRHDAETFAALYAPDATAIDPQYEQPLRGRDAIRKDIEDFFQAFPDLQARPVSASSVMATPSPTRWSSAAPTRARSPALPAPSPPPASASSFASRASPGWTAA